MEPWGEERPDAGHIRVTWLRVSRRLNKMKSLESQNVFVYLGPNSRELLRRAPADRLRLICPATTDDIFELISLPVYQKHLTPPKPLFTRFTSMPPRPPSVTGLNTSGLWPLSRRSELLSACRAIITAGGCVFAAVSAGLQLSVWMKSIQTFIFKPNTGFCHVQKKKKKLMMKRLRPPSLSQSR